MQTTAVISHYPCHDGVVAAALVHCKYKVLAYGEYNHGNRERSAFTEWIVVNKETLHKADVIFVLDCVPDSLSEFAHKTVLIDHHTSSEPLVEEYRDSLHTCIFNPGKICASELTYEYLQGSPVFDSDFIRAIGDHDVWRVPKGPNTVAVYSWLASTIRGYKSLESAVHRLCISYPGYDKVLEVGRVIALRDLEAARRRQTDLIQTMRTVRFAPLDVEIHVIHLTESDDYKHMGEIGSVLGKPCAFPRKSDDAGDVRVSFRSTPGHSTTALELAKCFAGGGGHEHAASCTMSTEDVEKNFV